MISLIFLVGCSSGNKGNNKDNGNDKGQLSAIQDYFPLKENVRYVYEGQGNEYASYNVMNDYIAEGRVQQRVDNGGTVLARVLEISEGKLTRLLSKEEAYYRENMLNVKTENEILLKEPLTKGTSWNTSDSRVRTITGTAVSVTTPSGNYEALEVTTQSANGTTKDYYAKNIGLVKSIFAFEGNEISSSLSKIEENIALKQGISFFYPNMQDGKIYYTDREISFKTNEITRSVLEAAYKESVNSNLGKVFWPNTKINSLYLNKDGMVYIDLNGAFLTEMNAGAGYESMILQCIGNTFGKYYNADKVILTIDNKLYESGHIVMQKGEFIVVNLNDVIYSP